MSTTPLSSSNLQNARDLKFLPEVYPDKRQSLPKFINGQLSGPYSQNGLWFIPYTHISRFTSAKYLVGIYLREKWRFAKF